MGRSDAVRAAIREIMDGRAALGRPGLLNKLEQMIEAKRIVFAQKDGVITDEREVADNSSQLRALNMAFTLRDEYPHHAAAAVGVNVNVVMERLPDLSHLPARELVKLAQLGQPGDEVVEADLVGDPVAE